MRRNRVIFGAGSLILALALSGCSMSFKWGEKGPVPGESEQNPKLTSEAGYDESHYLLPDDTAVTCLEYFVGEPEGVLSCYEITVTDKSILTPLEDSEYETVYLKSRRGEILLCISYGEDGDSALLSCLKKAR